MQFSSLGAFGLNQPKKKREYTVIFRAEPKDTKNEMYFVIKLPNFLQIMLCAGLNALVYKMCEGVKIVPGFPTKICYKETVFLMPVLNCNGQRSTYDENFFE